MTLHSLYSCVQITMAESFAVEDRGNFCDPVGALRDVVVSHPIQVVAAAAMEPPSRSVEAAWRVMQPLLDAPPPVQGCAKGSWGPAAADELAAGQGGWRGPWVAA